MLKIPIEKALTELAYTLARQLAEGQDVSLNGFGDFEVRHVASHIEDRSSGGMVVQPPRDIVIFSADMKESRD